MKRIIYFMMALLFAVVSLVPTTYAATSYPSIDSIISEVSDRPHYGYFINETEGVPVLLVFSSVSTADADFKFDIHSTYRIRAQLLGTDGKNYNFSWTTYSASNGSWERVAGSTNVSAESYLLSTEYPLIEGTHNIYNSDGTVFFTPPPTGMTLAEMVQEMTNQEMTKFPSIMVGIMKVLTLCGVGCLALLVVLKLFGKVWSIFRV